MAATARSRVHSGTVRFGSGIPAFRSLPRAREKRPAVILLHERYGVVQHTKDLTRKLAQGGFVGLAPDLFYRFDGDRKALERGEVRVQLRDEEVVKDLGESVDYLQRLPTVDPSRIGVVGICQTGRSSVLLAAHRGDVSACAVFYGAVGGREWETDELRPEPIARLVERLSCPLLGVFGEADHIIAVDDVVRLRACLEEHRKSYHLRIYRDAPHGWLNDTMPGRYRKDDARDAWRLLLTFLNRTLKKGWDRHRVLWTFESDIAPDYDFTKNVRLE